MSHFAVLAVLTQDMIQRAGGASEALTKLMIKYKEYGCGSEDPEGFEEEYCEWRDSTAEYRAEFEGEKEYDSSYLYYESVSNRIIEKLDITDKQRDILRAKIKAAVDEEMNRRSRDPLRIQTADSSAPLKAEVNRYLSEIGVKVEFCPKDLWDTMEEWIKDWHNSEPSENTPTPYGYYRNPNTKWDWYQIGGRWAGYLAKYAKGDHQKEYERGLYGFGVNTDEGFLRSQIDIEDMKGKAHEDARKWWMQFERCRPYLTDNLWLDDSKRSYVFNELREKDEELAQTLLWLDREKFFTFGWIKRILPEWRLITAKEHLQSIAQVSQTANGPAEVSYPETFEHPWGTYRTEDLLKAVNGTKFTTNRNIIDDKVRAHFGDEFYKEYLKQKEIEPDTAAYLKSLDIDWDSYLGDGETVEDHLFIERIEVSDKEPSIEDVLANAHLWEWGTYAVVDKDGWHSKGEMGWFGCSSNTPEEASEFQKSYIERFIENGNDDDMLVLIDCHI